MREIDRLRPRVFDASTKEEHSVADAQVAVVQVGRSALDQLVVDELPGRDARNRQQNGVGASWSGAAPSTRSYVGLRRSTDMEILLDSDRSNWSG